ncbi:hypothetical protein [Levilactobacillus lindianensis]|uniref:hypothetical protein n=1 Tax=Levilactobacillus lindianensis TaxID=2486018 RepID=UPI000F73769F|nr:hypothetical protein [Levilactobacillus lindianensis]
MAIYYRGKKEQTNGFRKLTLSPEPIDPDPSPMTIRQAFCMYRFDGKILELAGGVVFDSSNYALHKWELGLLKLPEFLSGTYTLDTTKGSIAGNAETINVNRLRNASAKLDDDILTILNEYSGAGAENVNPIGGAASFDLFFIKQ